MDKTMYESAIACLNNLIVRDLIKDPHGDHYDEVVEVLEKHRALQDHLEEHNRRLVRHGFKFQVAYISTQVLVPLATQYITNEEV